MAEITLTEGKKREVRRIFLAARNEVMELERTAIGGLKRQAAETAGVASRRGWNRSFPSTVEEVLGRKAVVAQGTARQMLE